MGADDAYIRNMDLSQARTLEDVYEPFLVREGYLARTPRGRVALPAAYAHVEMQARYDARNPPALKKLVPGVPSPSNSVC